VVRLGRAHDEDEHGRLAAVGWRVALARPATDGNADAASVGVVLAAGVVLVGAMTCCEHVLQADFGIDQLLATAAPR